MTKEEIIKLFSKKGCTNILISEDFDSNKTESEFYGGHILSFNYRGHKVELCAIGDVIGYVYHKDENGNLDEEQVEDRSNWGQLREIFDVNGVKSDSEIEIEYGYDMPEDEILEILNNHKVFALLDYSNWFEIFIDKKSEVWESDLSNIEELASELDDWIDWR